MNSELTGRHHPDAGSFRTAIEQKCKVCRLLYSKYGMEELFKEGKGGLSFWITRRNIHMDARALSQR